MPGQSQLDNGGACLPGGVWKLASCLLALFVSSSPSAVAQVIMFTNKAVTFKTLEGNVYRGVNLVKADAYGITWQNDAGGGRVAYTNLAEETLDNWAVPSNHVGRLAARELALKNAPRPADVALQKREEDNVREAAFKTLIYEAAAARDGYRVYFLCLGTTWTNDRPFALDPSDEFMKRFEGRIPPVKKASQSKIGERGEVRDKDSGQRGVIFTVTDLNWVSDQKGRGDLQRLQGRSQRICLPIYAYQEKPTLDGDGQDVAQHIVAFNPRIEHRAPLSRNRSLTAHLR